jgi:ABC-type dipeptide/oligopeptide/nickel transport system permease component
MICSIRNHNPIKKIVFDLLPNIVAILFCIGIMIAVQCAGMYGATFPHSWLTRCMVLLSLFLFMINSLSHCMVLLSSFLFMMNSATVHAHTVVDNVHRPCIFPGVQILTRVDNYMHCRCIVIVSSAWLAGSNSKIRWSMASLQHACRRALPS